MKTSRGFTLIELIIVITLIGILSAMSTLILRQTFKAYNTGKDISELATKTTVAMSTLMRELKSASSVTSLSATSVTFTNQQEQSVVINLNGTTLRRSVNGGAAQIVCNQVTSVAFGFFDQAFTTTAVAANVRFISMNIVTSTNGLPFRLMGGTVLRPLLS